MQEGLGCLRWGDGTCDGQHPWRNNGQPMCSLPAGAAANEFKSIGHHRAACREPTVLQRQASEQQLRALQCNKSRLGWERFVKSYQNALNPSSPESSEIRQFLRNAAKGKL